MKYRILIACFLCLLVPTSGSAQPSDTMLWMIGSWHIQTPRGIVVETWTVANDSTLAGTSVFVTTEKDTIPQEILELAFRNGGWAYTSIVFGHNENKPTRFEVIFARGMEFVSENPEHDFPQRIGYRRVGDQLFASIEGRRNGQFGKRNYDFMKE